jgi:hypothetical protein
LPGTFKRSALLKTVTLLWLTNGRTQFTWKDQIIDLVLDKDLGLRITRRKNITKGEGIDGASNTTADL